MIVCFPAIPLRTSARDSAKKKYDKRRESRHVQPLQPTCTAAKHAVTHKVVPLYASDLLKRRLRCSAPPQIPHLNKMKKELNTYAVAFARMATDVMLTGWDPEFELALLELQQQVEELQQEEREIELMDTPDEELLAGADDACKTQMDVEYLNADSHSSETSEQSSTCCD